MKKYKTTDKANLGRISKDDDDDYNLFLDLTRSIQWNRVYKSAQEEISDQLNRDEKTYYELFMSFEENQRGKVLTVDQTGHFLNEYCAEQSLSFSQFLQRVYCLLKQLQPKVNTLYLQGESNAGKTFLTTMIVPFPEVVGSHISSREFPFQECAYKPLILINELTLSNATEAELYKNVLGGEPTYINIKNKPGQLMMRRPVILTSNHPVWRFVLNERVPLLNRMFSYLNLRKSDVCRRYSADGAPNYKFLQICFKFLEEYMIQNNISADETFHTKAILRNLSPLDVLLKEYVVLDSDEDIESDVASANAPKSDDDSPVVIEYPVTPNQEELLVYGPSQPTETPSTSPRPTTPRPTGTKRTATVAHDSPCCHKRVFELRDEGVQTLPATPKKTRRPPPLADRSPCLNVIAVEPFRPNEEFNPFDAAFIDANARQDSFDLPPSQIHSPDDSADRTSGDGRDDSEDRDTVPDDNNNNDDNAPRYNADADDDDSDADTLLVFSQRNFDRRLRAALTHLSGAQSTPLRRTDGTEDRRDGDGRPNDDGPWLRSGPRRQRLGPTTTTDSRRANGDDQERDVSLSPIYSGASDTNTLV